MRFVGWRKNFGLVNIVDAQLLQDLRLREMTDAALGHDGNIDHRHDLANHFRRGHARPPAFGADLRRDALQSHHRYRSGSLGDLRLFRGGDVHDDAALEHFGEPGLQAKVGSVSIFLLHGVALFREQLSAFSFQPSAISTNPYGCWELVALTFILQPVHNSRYPGLARVENSVVAGLCPARTGPFDQTQDRLRPVPTRASAVYKPRKHAARINRDEQAPTARQYFPFFVQDLGHIDVLPALHLNLARFHAQWLHQRHRLQVVHGNLGSQRHHVTQFVHLAHRFIENRRDNAAVAVSGRSVVALAQPESAHEAVALLVVSEAQPHAVRVVLAADEAVVLS